ncbi:MAG: hypothetical protein JWO38_6833 [Gemmataceae bacterium]|nr:hypothetical protein [Gemmataceae bacterium]
MRRSRSVMFDVGLAAGGCFIALPGVPWFWPFGDPYACDGWPLLAGTFAACYGLVRLIDRVASGVESAVARAVRQRLNVKPLSRPPDLRKNEPPGTA